MVSARLLLYRLLIHGALPVVAPATLVSDRVSGKQRPPFSDRMARNLPAWEPRGIWIQAVSVGEVELARRLTTELRHQAPELPLLVTSTTATGLALATRTMGEQLPVHPCPLDLPGPVRRVLDAARPRLLVLVETELWPELLHQAGRRGIPVAVVNARLSDRSLARYQRVRRLLQPLLEPIKLVLARAPADASGFTAIGIAEQRIRVAGNIKYDLEPDKRPLPWQEQMPALAGDRPVVVAGSTMEGEESQVLAALELLQTRQGPAPFLILAPRHPERFEAVAGLLEQRGIRFTRRSHIDARPADVLLLDTIGELARAYQLATLAFIGGSLVPTGGHNPLEPAVWAVPSLSGPHVFNFREVYEELVGAGAVHLVDGPEQLATAMQTWLTDQEQARRAGASAAEVVRCNRGATARTAAELLTLGGLARS